MIEDLDDREIDFIVQILDAFIEDTEFPNERKEARRIADKIDDEGIIEWNVLSAVMNLKKKKNKKEY